MDGMFKNVYHESPTLAKAFIKVNLFMYNVHILIFWYYKMRYSNSIYSGIWDGLFVPWVVPAHLAHSTRYQLRPCMVYWQQYDSSDLSQQLVSLSILLFCICLHKNLKEEYLSIYFPLIMSRQYWGWDMMAINWRKIGGTK